MKLYWSKDVVYSGIKVIVLCWVQWLIPVILATWEAEIMRMVV
jgi:hypothetical protein